jgi:superfamily II DNA or RNA helicase
MLSAEYSIRYSNGKFKVHKSWDKLGKILETTPKNIEDNGWIDPPQCMPDSCKDDDVVRAYRNYYIQEKKSFAKWNYTREPEWMLN